MRRQRRDGAKPAALGMGNVERARVQVQPVFELAEAFGRHAAIFEVADDRRADMGEMGADLMGSPGDGTQRDPGILVRRRAHHGVVGRRRLGVLLARFGRSHLFVAAVFALLGKRELDDAAMRDRNALGQSPIGFLGVAAAQAIPKARLQREACGRQR